MENKSTSCPVMKCFYLIIYALAICLETLLLSKDLVVREADWIAFMDRDHRGRDENLVFGRQFNAKADCRSSKLLIRLAGIRSCLPVLPLVMCT